MCMYRDGAKILRGRVEQWWRQRGHSGLAAWALPGLLLRRPGDRPCECAGAPSSTCSARARAETSRRKKSVFLR
eukprot:4800456-Pyramimonas_sp.AAC.1